MPKPAYWRIVHGRLGVHRRVDAPGVRVLPRLARASRGRPSPRARRVRRPARSAVRTPTSALVQGTRASLNAPKLPPAARLNTAAFSTTRIEVKDLEIRYGEAVAVDGVSFTVDGGRARDPARALGLRQDHDAAGHRRSRAAAVGQHPHRRARVFDVQRAQNIPTEQRGVSMVFQSYAVWPHMTVFDNVAYGLRVRKLPRGRDQGQRRARARPGADARPRRAAGLQALRRPAAARGAGPRPRLLARRSAVRRAAQQPRRQAARRDARRAASELQRRLDITSVYVTHDQEEALAISDRVIVMNDGVIEQIGTPERDLRPPAQPLRRRLRRLGQHHQGQAFGRRLVRDRRWRHPEGDRRAQAARQRERSRDPHGLYRPRSAARRQPRARHGAPAPVPRRLRAIRHRQRARLAQCPPATGEPAGRGRSRDAVVFARTLRALGSVRERGPLARMAITAVQEARAPVRPAQSPPRSRDASAGARLRDSRRWPCAWCSGCPRSRCRPAARRGGTGISSAWHG